MKPQSCWGPIVVCCLAALCGCKEHYRIGDRVIVKWCEGEYPAFIVAQRGAGLYRVHLEDYDSRWDTDVGLEEVVRRQDFPGGAAPPLCPRVARALGLDDAKLGRGGPQVGARIKVTFRGSVYRATVKKVLGTDRFLVSYDGHSSAWDEVISAERIVGGG